VTDMLGPHSKFGQFISKDQFHAELHQARIIGRGDGSKRRGTTSRVGCQEVRLVQKIEGLSPELQECPSFMSQHNFLRRCKIELRKIVRSHRIAAYMSEGTRAGRNDHGVLVEVIGDSALILTVVAGRSFRTDKPNPERRSFEGQLVH